MSSVIKLNGACRPPVTGEVFYIDLGKGSEEKKQRDRVLAARQKAEAIEEEARRRAQEIVAEAEARAEEIRSAAREQGLAEAHRIADERCAEALAHLASLVEAVEAERERFLETLEPELIKLAVEIAHKVIKQELQTNPEAVLPSVRAAPRRIKDKEAVRIVVHPRDLELVRQAREDLMALVDGVRALEIVDDRRVGAGGCVIEFRNGTLDARVDTQLALIRQALLKEADEEFESADD